VSCCSASAAHSRRMTRSLFLAVLGPGCSIPQAETGPPVKAKHPGLAIRAPLPTFLSLGDLTVLAAQAEPARVDTRPTTATPNGSPRTQSRGHHLGNSPARLPLRLPRSAAMASIHQRRCPLAVARRTLREAADGSATFPSSELLTSKQKPQLHGLRQSPCGIIQRVSP
jgi:hypothetical protein